MARRGRMLGGGGHRSGCQAPQLRRAVAHGCGGAPLASGPRCMSQGGAGMRGRASAGGGAPVAKAQGDQVAGHQLRRVHLGRLPVALHGALRGHHRLEGGWGRPRCVCWRGGGAGVGGRQGGLLRVAARGVTAGDWLLGDAAGPAHRAGRSNRLVCQAASRHAAHACRHPWPRRAPMTLLADRSWK